MGYDDDHVVCPSRERGDVMLTNDLVDLAITNTGGAGESAKGRGTEVEGSRADGATRRRRKGGTGSPGEGGNAAILREKRKANYQLSGRLGSRSGGISNWA